MEIYNEEINDLLAPENRKLRIHENLEVLLLSISPLPLNWVKIEAKLKVAVNLELGQMLG